jgi:hypothetical protein
MTDEERKQAIRDVEEEIEAQQILATSLHYASEENIPNAGKRLDAVKRTITRLQAALADLKRGLRVAE